MGIIFNTEGEMGSVFMLVDYALKNGLIPLHAVSERKTVEKKNEDGTSIKTAIFEHVCFRWYDSYNAPLQKLAPHIIFLGICNPRYGKCI